MAPPRRDHVRLVVYVAPGVAQSLREEAKKRGKSHGEIITEALQMRVVQLFRHSQEQPK